jgi:anti-anti-sigma regulatory factor
MTARVPSTFDPREHSRPRDPRSSSGSASGTEEYAAAGLEGQLPAGVRSLEQAVRSYKQYRARAEGRASSVAAAGSVAVIPQNADGAWLIVLEGEHDLSTAALLVQATIGLWQRCALAVVDVSRAAFIDTTVIDWLMYAKCMLGASGTLVIVEGPPSSAAARLFRLLGLCEVVACVPTRQDALARMRTGSRTSA